MPIEDFRLPIGGKEVDHEDTKNPNGEGRELPIVEFRLPIGGKEILTTKHTKTTKVGKQMYSRFV